MGLELSRLPPLGAPEAQEAPALSVITVATAVARRSLEVKAAAAGAVREVRTVPAVREAQPTAALLQEAAAGATAGELRDLPIQGQLAVTAVTTPEGLDTVPGAPLAMWAPPVLLEVAAVVEDRTKAAAMEGLERSGMLLTDQAAAAAAMEMTGVLQLHRPAMGGSTGAVVQAATAIPLSLGPVRMESSSLPIRPQAAGVRIFSPASERVLKC